jgi:hypothetical protein
MAALRLTKEECKAGKLPMLCMVCGEPTTITESKVFTARLRIPGLFLFTMLAHWVGLINSRYHVDVPICEKHRNYWRKRKRPFLILLILLIILLATGAFLFIKLESGWGALLFGVAVFGLFIWSLFAWGNNMTTLRATRIDSDQLRLDCVSNRFAKAVEESRKV